MQEQKDKNKENVSRRTPDRPIRDNGGNRAPVLIPIYCNSTALSNAFEPSKYRIWLRLAVMVAKKGFMGVDQLNELETIRKVPPTNVCSDDALVVARDVCNSIN